MEYGSWQQRVIREIDEPSPFDGGDSRKAIELADRILRVLSMPDLYEACKQALRTFEAHNIKPFDPRYLMLKKALSKVEENK